MRISSILSLRIEDVAHEDMVRNRIRVRRATVKGKRSGYDMALHAEAATALQKLIHTLKDTRPMAFVFPGRFRGTPLNRIRAWRIYKAAVAKVGIAGGRGELGMHTIRKTYAKRVFALSAMTQFALLMPYGIPAFQRRSDIFPSTRRMWIE